MRWSEAEVSRVGEFESQLLDLGEMVSVRHLIPAGFDSAPPYRGLPDDMCPCEHWCYLVEGRLRYRFADGDELRSSPRVAEEYAVLKRDLAERFADDREAYTDGKADFIRRVIERR